MELFLRLVVSPGVTSETYLGILLQKFKHRIDPNDKLYTAYNLGIATLAAKVKNGHLLLLHETFHDRYDPNQQDADGNTVLMNAVAKYPRDVIKELLKHPHLDVTLENNNGHTALDLVKDNVTVDEKLVNAIQQLYDEQMTSLSEKKEECLNQLGSLENTGQSLELGPTSGEFKPGPGVFRH